MCLLIYVKSIITKLQFIKLKKYVIESGTKVDHFRKSEHIVIDGWGRETRTEGSRGKRGNDCQTWRVLWKTNTVEVS